MTFDQNIWDITGEHTFDGYTALLNPSIQVVHATIQPTAVTLHLKVNENNGVFDHNFSVRSTEVSQSEVDLIVEEVILENFPTAVLRQ